MVEIELLNYDEHFEIRVLCEDVVGVGAVVVLMEGIETGVGVVFKDLRIGVGFVSREGVAVFLG